MTESKTVSPLGLHPMKRYDPSEVVGVSGLMSAMTDGAFGARRLGEAVDVAEEMLTGDNFVVLTITGAMTMAGLSLLIVEMIERGWVNAIVSTGALVGHGLTEDLGLKHYKTDWQISDETYLANRLNRVYDVIEPEDNLDALESEISSMLSPFFESLPKSANLSSVSRFSTQQLLQFMGERLQGRGVLQAATKAAVPVYIPAFTDSELGLDVACYNMSSNQETHFYDGFLDLKHYTMQCVEAKQAGRDLGIFTIGGGVPRNWAQQVAPFVDVSNQRVGKNRPVPRFKYGLRICPDPVHYGHLSGCTYSEGVSWGKFIPESEGGRFAEVLMDATVAWPLIVQALIERQ